MKKILQVFRKAFHKKETIYLCDPKKNSACSKEGCWYIQQKGPCKCTQKKRFAKTGEDGKPTIASDDDVTNLEWVEMQIFKEEAMKF